MDRAYAIVLRVIHVPNAYSTIHDPDQRDRSLRAHCERCAAKPSEPCINVDVWPHEPLSDGDFHYVRMVRAAGGLEDKGRDRDTSSALRERPRCMKKLPTGGWCTLDPNHVGLCGH